MLHFPFLLTALLHQPTIDAADLAFLAGTWRGEMGPMMIEETWLPPESGNLTGVFRMTRDGGVPLVEIMTITEEEDDALIYRLRHFDAALVPWESEAEGPIEASVTLRGEGRLRFTPLDPESDLAWFDYVVEGETLTASVNFKDAAREPFVLTFERVGE